jgi:hypothetical protein
MRTYSKLDLLRLKKFTDNRSDINPVHLLEIYDKDHPKKTAKEKYLILKKAIESQCECTGDMQIIGCKAEEDCIHVNYSK